MPRLRFKMMLGPTLLALLLAAQPAAAFTPVETGTVGELTVSDSMFSPGIACTYENNAGFNDDELDRIAIHKLWSHGPFHAFTKVGFKYVIKRNALPHNDGVFTTWYESPIVKKSANDEEVAFFGPITYHVPENTTSQWRVRIVLYYYAQGSSTNVIGTSKGVLEVYNHKISNAPSYKVGNEGDPGYCRREFH